MKFYISTLNDNGSGMEYNNKAAFLKELSMMINDCIENGGTRFDVQVDANASCFYEDYEIDSMYHDASEDELKAIGAFGS